MCKTLRDMNAYNEHEGNDSFGTELFNFMQWYISKQQSARAILQILSFAISEITIKSMQNIEVLCKKIVQKYWFSHKNNLDKINIKAFRQDSNYNYLFLKQEPEISNDVNFKEIVRNNFGLLNCLLHNIAN